MDLVVFCVWNRIFKLRVETGQNKKGLVCGKVYEYIVYIGTNKHLKNSNRSYPLLFFLPSFVVVLLLLLFTFYFFVVA